MRHWLLLWLACVLLLALGGCAVTPKPDVVAGVADPYESMNRKVFAFNDALDKAIFKPVATGYKTVMPEPVRTCVSNIFGNIADIYTAVNNALQGKFKEAGSDLCRVAINSTLGLLGCFDVATELGFEKHNEDFGQTLATWGVGAGPYLVLPFFGPSTLRDSTNVVIDWATYPVNQITPIYVRNSVRALRLIDTRALLLEASNLADDAALDKYQFIRDAYLQRRRYLIYDGDPPEEPLPKYEDETVPPASQAEPISTPVAQPATVKLSVAPGDRLLNEPSLRATSLNVTP
ncbi:VacJ family lipoprotein [Parvibium lacunae]|uniref:VacJ family lipoprotein n=2 Tax=Parvibium lacunae TaxID=1888893 RepID=A0A368L232_9BURK|nr:VacJ family lipoprotein [Parvibium lacunae]